MNKSNYPQHSTKRRGNQPAALRLDVDYRPSDELVVTCYGAGNEVGRSCILVEMSGKRILLDCGVNIGTNNQEERLPKLPSGPITVDLVLISHIHSDHLCSLPYLTEKRKCDAPVYMSSASRRLAPIMLEDFIKVTKDQIKDNLPFTSDQIKNSIQKVNVIEFNQRICCNGIYVLALPAGHLLGATAFYVSCNGRSFLYTGDFSGAADHHLSGHRIPRLYPDLMITESTYGNKIRDPMYRRERSFVQMVHRCVLQGGKVLIPVFAVGRLQEILMMLDDYWGRMQCKYPIYFSSGMGALATEEYKKCIMCMNSTVQTNFFDFNKQSFKFSRVIKYNKEMNADLSQCVMVATSGMLNNGPAFDFFVNKRWYEDRKNLIIFPGYCGEGTLGRAVLERPDDDHIVFEHPNGTTYDFYVKCKVERVSFSAHADKFEIITMCERVRPKSALCIHGDAESCKSLAESIQSDLKIDARVTNNCTPVEFQKKEMKVIRIAKDCIDQNSPNVFAGAIVSDSNDDKLRVIPITQAAQEAGLIARKIHLKRRVSTSASFTSICDLVRELKLADEDEILEPMKPIQTKYFLMEFLENSQLLISYELRFRSKVNKFCCLVVQDKPPQ